MENLIVISKVKKFIKEQGDFNTSSGFFEPLNEDVIKSCRDAVSHAQKLGRKTVMGKDFNLYMEGKKCRRSSCCYQQGQKID
jgi:histone H3/H4